MEEYYLRLLELYTLDELLELNDMEPVELLALLDDMELLRHDLEVPA